MRGYQPHAKVAVRGPLDGCQGRIARQRLLFPATAGHSNRARATRTWWRAWREGFLEGSWLLACEVGAMRSVAQYAGGGAASCSGRLWSGLCADDLEQQFVHETAQLPRV